jgi:polysaccharide export outer membrane protein
VNVLGAVLKPGTYQLTRRVFLLDALAMAGGLAVEKAEPKVYIHRAPGDDAASAPEGASDTLEIDLEQLLEKGDVRLNVPVYAGDVVSVPERVERFFYVLGDVNRGGAFEVRRGEAITLTKALASAGGLMLTAKGKKSVVIRQGADGVTEQIPINVGKVLKGEVPDMVLADNDVVFVPGSTTKTIGRGMLGSIGSVLTAIAVVGVRGY